MGAAPIQHPKQIFLKRNTIRNARALFHLDEDEEESLANKAGLSFTYGLPHEYQPLFSVYLNGLIQNKAITLSLLAQILSERMLGYIRAGMLPSKESAIAIGVLLNLNLPDMQNLLNRAGYILSESLPNDLIILWMLQKHQPPKHTRSGALERLFLINETLADHGFPLLMTRNKARK